MSGRRTSSETIDRDRQSSYKRYHRNPEQRRQTQKAYREERFENRPFIGWDSEGYNFYVSHPDGTTEIGPQRTMLFGCSVPGEYITGMDLSSEEMLALIIRVESLFPDAFHVGFSFEYDINQILKDLPFRMLAILKITGKVKYKGYHISHVPHKLISVTKDGISATIYDAFGFFHCKYLTALKKYHVGSDDTIQRIAQGKARRGLFTWADIDEVTEYWKAEISLLPLLMECVRDAAYGGGFRISAWHGPGALASYGLRYNGVREWMSRNVPAYARAAIRAAYAGGRFQAWRCGLYEGPVWTLDKNSAYVQAISILPRLDNGKWRRDDPGRIKSRDDIARFGLYHIYFDDNDREKSRSYRAKGIPERPYPLFHRDRNGKLTWPSRVDGWYWSPEARLVAGDPRAKFLEAVIYDDDGTFPFRFVNDSYETRLRLQEAGNPAEKAYKWALAAMYGSFARRVGWDRKRRSAPRSHELAWAGYITSHCRAAIFDVASYAASKGALISVDTDGVSATVPFPESLVPEGFSTKLGAWKQEEWTGVLYWQNGIYWYRDSEGNWSEAKSRGVPKGKIDIEDAFKALEEGSFTSPYRPPRIQTKKTKYIGYRQALNQQFDRWRRWVTEDVTITFGGTGKGTHIPVFCRACRTEDSSIMHTVTHLPPKTLESTEHKLPWLTPKEDTSIGDVQDDDFGSDFMGTQNEIFYEGDLDDRL